MYTIKNIKNFKGRGGVPCSQGTLHSDEWKVADWSDSPSGGVMEFHFKPREEEGKFVDFARTFLATQKDYSGELYKVTEMDPMLLIETAIFKMSVAVQEEAALRNAAKKGIAIYVTDDREPGGKALFVSKSTYTAENVASLRAKYPKLVEIVNETLGMPLGDDEAGRIADRNRRYRTACRTATIFIVTDADGKQRDMRLNKPYNTTVASELRSNHPNLVEIVNERFL